MTTQIFSHHAAVARIRRLDSGVSEVVYCGPMGCNEFSSLRQLALDATAGSGCLVVRMDKALITMGCAPPTSGPHYSANQAPAAFVVREDQFEIWRDYAHQSAKRGIMRAVFLEEFAPLAYRWALAHAAFHCAVRQ